MCSRTQAPGASAPVRLVSLRAQHGDCEALEFTHVLSFFVGHVGNMTASAAALYRGRRYDKWCLARRLGRRRPSANESESTSASTRLYIGHNSTYSEARNELLVSNTYLIPNSEARPALNVTEMHAVFRNVTTYDIYMLVVRTQQQCTILNSSSSGTNMDE
jgi:hypothetical protein